jgi:pimeloyl-ACP methyl ester carboxylesterase
MKPKHVTSRDGTAIAFDRVGSGPPVVLVDGALCTRTFGPMPRLAAELARQFTVFTYDRRGRGDSGQGATYAVEREIEDLKAVIDEAGGSACAFGISSGAVLALGAAARGVPIEKLALYEPPFIVDRSRPTTESSWARIDEALAAGRRGDALRAFLKSVGLPAIAVGIMRWTPMWSRLEAIAPTLPHDGAIVGEYQRGEPLPAGRWASATIPTLAIHGAKSPAWMRDATRALAAALPNADCRSLDGQTHDVKAKVVAPVLTEFFAGCPR